VEINGDIVRSARIDKCWSMETLANKSDLSYATVYAFEHGRKTPFRHSTKSALINALGLRKEKEKENIMELNKNSPWSMKIRTVREMKGLTQTKLSQMSGITLTAIQNYECGAAIPGEQHLTRICNHLGLEYYHKEKDKFDVSQFIEFIKEFESMQKENKKLREEVESFKKSIKALKPLIELAKFVEE